MRRADWDTVVIGAGIHGAGCAQVLTTYRVTAARVAGLLVPRLPQRARRADTATLRLGLGEA